MVDKWRQNNNKQVKTLNKVVKMDKTEEQSRENTGSLESEDSSVLMDAPRHKGELVGANYDLNYLHACLSNIPIGASCLYVATSGSYLHQLPPKRKEVP